MVGHLLNVTTVATLTEQFTTETENTRLQAMLPVNRVGPTGQGPSKTRQGPGKNYWTDHVP